MKIQVINYTKQAQDGEILYSTLSVPRSIDEFDVVIVDLSDESLWKNNSLNFESINCKNDFFSIQKMVQNHSSATVVYVLPSNVKFLYHKTRDGSYYCSIRLKDMLESLNKMILPCVLPCGLYSDIVYENTNTTLGDITYDAAFFFRTNLDVKTKSDRSNKATTIQLKDDVFLTTLQITNSTNSIHNFIAHILVDQQKEATPEWMKSISFFDDVEQEKTITESKIKIQQEELIINQANARLVENALYKSVLYTTGDELVEVVFKILEQILDYDLSGFVDEKKADFIIKKKDYTLIGEIKGINSNVKNENISQLDNHFQPYMDELQTAGKEENVYQLLIINPFRNKPLFEREPINENQIKLAKRNEALIIETKTLLKLFESFLQGKKTVEDCEKLFTTNIGLLTEEDFV